MPKRMATVNRSNLELYLMALYCLKNAAWDNDKPGIRYWNKEQIKYYDKLTQEEKKWCATTRFNA